MNIFKSIKNSFSKSINGEEKIWKVFWLWGILIYFGTVVLGFLALLEVVKLSYSPSSTVQSIAALLTLISLLIGIFLIYIFPTIFLIAITACGKTYQFTGKRKTGIFFRKVFPVIFMIFHSIYYTMFVGMGTLLFFAFIIEFEPIRPLFTNVKQHFYSSDASSLASFGVISSLAIPVIFFTVRYLKNWNKNRLSK